MYHGLAVETLWLKVYVQNHCSNLEPPVEPPNQKFIGDMQTKEAKRRLVALNLTGEMLLFCDEIFVKVISNA